MIFKSNDSLYEKSSSANSYKGTWNTTGKQLCFLFSDGFIECNRFEFENNDKTIKLYESGPNEQIILIKK